MIKKEIIFRLHESGDFYNQKYVNKWITIARYFESVDSRIVFMAYTKSVEYFKGVDIPKNMIIRFSLWDDTKPEQLEIAKALKLPIYTADTADKVEHETKKKNNFKCECADCANCGACWDKSKKAIYCTIH